VPSTAVHISTTSRAPRRPARLLPPLICLRALPVAGEFTLFAVSSYLAMPSAFLHSAALPVLSTHFFSLLVFGILLMDLQL
ncbi:hypothetical protein EDB89DRAFT_1946689, partial [Lactarius sanguifluus]